MIKSLLNCLINNDIARFSAVFLTSIAADPPTFTYSFADVTTVPLTETL